MGATVSVTCGAPHFLHMGEEGVSEVYGLIGKMIAVAGQSDTLLTILFDSVGDMPGCLSYIIAKDPADENALWITEVFVGFPYDSTSVKKRNYMINLKVTRCSTPETSTIPPDNGIPKRSQVLLHHPPLCLYPISLPRLCEAQ